MIDGETFATWLGWAKRDDWHLKFVGSDIRVMLADLDRLRTVQAAATDLINECDGGRNSPSLGALAVLESAVHLAWKSNRETA